MVGVVSKYIISSTQQSRLLVSNASFPTPSPNEVAINVIVLVCFGIVAALVFAFVIVVVVVIAAVVNAAIFFIIFCFFFDFTTFDSSKSEAS